MAELFALLVILALDFLLVAGGTWVICWALGLIGVELVWTWLLAFVVWVILKVIKLIK